MNEQAWTQEPWYLEPKGFGGKIRTEEHGFVIVEARSPYTNREYRELDWANANRVVDCVNAMSGIPNPAEFVRAARELAEATDAVSDRIAYYAQLKERGEQNIEDWAYSQNSDDLRRFRAALSAFRAAGGGQ